MEASKANGRLDEAVGLPDALLKRLRAGELWHAVLLVGESSQAERAARWLAQALLCEAPRADAPCGRCRSCAQFSAGSHPDFWASGDKGLKAGDVEALQAWLATKGHGTRKVYVLRGADEMTPVAANRMLKTLEEPAPETYAILTAQSRQKVLSTLRSRSFTCLLSASPPFLSTDPTSIAVVTRATSAEDPSFAGLMERVIEWTQTWQSGGATPWELAASWQSIAKDVPAEDGLLLLAEWLRELMRVRAGGQAERFGAWEEAVRRIAPILEVEQYAACVQAVMEARLRLQSHVALLLNLEQMCVRLREVTTSW
ncbi:hypothetical protein IW967_07925 [Alicyclobacillus mali]|uniref:DNA polymerase-3 subunit delta n=1 Tax=Alicyclobacillus mali (ex Roth et al. 2021) TaxID=1123961 RepID=A0ABS0F3C0_9BACL|nr:hypothetical protein [Alicyclobacillus mali (ex Roth et al. 2021)]MBF8377793.1 hypothetical protein [Alicyclobacillus mali (ex Roth et al. 2021)]